MTDRASSTRRTEHASYKGYLITLLTVVMTFNCLEGQSLGLLMEDIKVDLHLSDMQLGLLTGMAYALFYTIMGIPIAHWADRGNRVVIIAISTALSGAMMALYGIAGSFLQLVLMRIGAAVGAGGYQPAGLSLIADYFTRAERPHAIGKFNSGAPLCSIVGTLAAGWLSESFGWRMTFVMLGVPTLAVAGLVWMTAKEPRVTETDVTAASTRNEEISPSFKDVAHGLWKSVTMRHLIAFQVTTVFFGAGPSLFGAVFLIRNYGLKTGELGTWFAVIYGITGLVGNYGGGAWASRRAASNERLQLKVAAIMYSCVAVSTALIYLSTSLYSAVAMMAIAALAAAIPSCLIYATVQTIVPARARALSIVFMSLLANLVGLGLGPVAVGALSDALHPMFGDESLRYAMLAVCPGYLWGGWHLWRASQTVTRDLHAAQERSEGAFPEKEKERERESTGNKVSIAR